MTWITADPCHDRSTSDTAASAKLIEDSDRNSIGAPKEHAKDVGQLGGLDGLQEHNVLNIVARVRRHTYQHQHHAFGKLKETSNWDRKSL